MKDSDRDRLPRLKMALDGPSNGRYSLAYDPNYYNRPVAWYLNGEYLEDWTGGDSKVWAMFQTLLKNHRKIGELKYTIGHIKNRHGVDIKYILKARMEHEESFAYIADLAPEAICISKNPDSAREFKDLESALEAKELGDRVFRKWGYKFPWSVVRVEQ